MQRDGLFIALEGIDGAGKATQCALLRQRLEKLGYEVAIFDFPRYNNPSSYFIKQYLNGEYGTLEQVGPYTAALFYALDRYDAASEIRKAILQGKVVITDRFVGSNMAHQGAKLNHPEERRGFFLWLDTLEFRMMNIPRPERSIVLQLPADQAQIRVDEKLHRAYTNKTRDLHEASLQHLRQTADAYNDLCQLFPRDFIGIDCFRNNVQLTTEQIGELIWGKVEPLLPDLPPKPAPVPESTLEAEEQLSQPRTTSLLAATAGGATDRMIGDTLDKPTFYTPVQFDDKTKELYQQSMAQLFELHDKIATTLRSIRNDSTQQLAQLVLPVATLVTVQGDADIAELTADSKLAAQTTLSAMAAELQKNYSDESVIVRLANYWPRNELDIVPAILYEYSNQSFGDIQLTVSSWPYDKKSFVLRSYVQEPASNKRTLDSVLYNWEILTEFQTIADLRFLSVAGLDWQLLSPRLGYDVPAAIEQAGLADDFERCFDLSLELYSALQAAGYMKEAQYATLLGHRARAKLTTSAGDLSRMNAGAAASDAHPAVSRLTATLLDYISSVHPLLAAAIRPDTPPVPPAAPKQAARPTRPKRTSKRDSIKRRLDK